MLPLELYVSNFNSFFLFLPSAFTKLTHAPGFTKQYIWSL